MMRQQKKGIYLNYPVFISGSSMLSNGRALVLDPANPIFQQWSEDHQSRRGHLTEAYTLACLPALMLEDYLSANNRTNILENHTMRRLSLLWILFSCCDQNHHKGHLFSITIPIRRRVLGVIVRLIGKFWSWRHFGLTNYFRAKTILLPEDSTVLSVQELFSPVKV
jgi:hypothetical protein